MAPIELTPIELEMVVKLRKPHACGGYEWTIVRLGADIGLKCNSCGRRVLLPRREFERRLARKLTDKLTDKLADKRPDKLENSPSDNPLGHT